MATKSNVQLRTFRVLAKVTVESWHNIKAQSWEQAGATAEELAASAFVKPVGELYEYGKLEITSISTEE